jgi:hypothetical protein
MDLHLTKSTHNSVTSWEHWYCLSSRNNAIEEMPLRSWSQSKSRNMPHERKGMTVRGFWCYHKGLIRFNLMLSYLNTYLYLSEEFDVIFQCMYTVPIDSIQPFFHPLSTLHSFLTSCNNYSTWMTFLIFTYKAIYVVIVFLCLAYFSSNDVL